MAATIVEEKQKELLNVLLKCGYSNTNAALRTDAIIENEITKFEDYDWWINYYKGIYDIA